jgi:hypothetical protein
MRSSHAGSENLPENELPQNFIPLQRVFFALRPEMPILAFLNTLKKFSMSSSGRSLPPSFNINTRFFSK